MKHAWSAIVTTLLTAVVLGTRTVAAGTVTDSYAIAVSAAVMNDPDWKAATVDILKAKYPQATLSVWKNSVDEVCADLAKTLPAYTAFVMKPEEAGTKMTIAISNLCRALDDDPYVDTFWSVITGYDAPSAKLLAEAKPIAVERGLDCANTDMKAFEECWRYSEDHRGKAKYWKRGTTDGIETSDCDTDNTPYVLERLQKDKVQFLATSGHATQHDWQMGYCGPNMAMIHKEGKLYVVDTKKKLHPAGSTEPKVYIAAGNCLIGDIDKPDCMALSWMKDGGVRQFMGYTVTTWFGAQGWGTLGHFAGHAGFYTMNEAFHFTNTGIVKAIADTGIPEAMSYRMEKIEHLNMPKLPETAVNAWAARQVAAGINQKELPKAFQTIVGNLHDRDTVCVYGDPALNARMALCQMRPLEAQVFPAGLSVGIATANDAAPYNGNIWLRLPGSWTYDVAKAKLPKQLGKPDLVLDNMIRFPNADLQPGRSYRILLQGARPKRPGTMELRRTPARSGKVCAGIMPSVQKVTE